MDYNLMKILNYLRALKNEREAKRGPKVVKERNTDFTKAKDNIKSVLKGIGGMFAYKTEEQKPIKQDEPIIQEINMANEKEVIEEPVEEIQEEQIIEEVKEINQPEEEPEQPEPKVEKIQFKKPQLKLSSAKTLTLKSKKIEKEPEVVKKKPKKSKDIVRINDLVINKDLINSNKF